MVVVGIFFLLLMLLHSVVLQTRRYALISAGANQSNIASITAARLARKLLDRAGLNDTEVRRGDDCLGDFYDVAQNVIYFDRALYSDDSLTSVAISIHEVGHACNESRLGIYYRLASTLYQCSSLLSTLSWVALAVGIVLQSELLIWLGIGGSIGGFFLQMPHARNEAKASKRGMQELVQVDLLTSDEHEKVEAILKMVSKGFAGGAIAALLSRIVARCVPKNLA